MSVQLRARSTPPMGRRTSSISRPKNGNSCHCQSKRRQKLVLLGSTAWSTANLALPRRDRVQHTLLVWLSRKEAPNGLAARETRRPHRCVEEKSAKQRFV